jgi:antitoxin ParD1/3/4
MPTMNISLSEVLKEFVEAQVSSGKYASASEYVRELVRDDLKRRERDRIEQAVLAGLNSGDLIEMTREEWDRLRREVLASENAV